MGHPFLQNFNGMDAKVLNLVPDLSPILIPNIKFNMMAMAM